MRLRYWALGLAAFNVATFILASAAGKARFEELLVRGTLIATYVWLYYAILRGDRLTDHIDAMRGIVDRWEAGR